MNRILKLYRMLRKNDEGTQGQTEDQKGSGGTKSAIWIVRLMIAVLLGFVGFRFADAIQTVGGGAVIFRMTGLVAGVVALCLGIFTLLKNMYMSSDIELLITLPFSSREIAILRVITCLLKSFIYTVILVLPVQIGLSLVFVQPAAVYIASILSCVLIPVFVTAAVSVLVMLVMAFVTLLRNIQVLRYIAAVLAFLGILAYYFFYGSDQAAVSTMFSAAANLTEKWSYAIPVVGLLQGYLAGSALNLLWAVLITAAAAALFLLGADKLYLKGALNMQNAKTGRSLTDEAFEKLCRKKKPVDALIAKEYRMVRRNPAYFTNNFLYGFLWPLIALLVMRRIVPDLLSSVADTQGGFSLPEYLAQPETFAFLTPILCAVITFVVWMPLMGGSFAFSSLSREGKSFFIMKQIPISYRDQLKAKRKMADRFAQLTTTAYVLVLLVLLCIIIGMPLYYIIIPVILTALFSAEFVAADMLAGIKGANVNWDDERIGAGKSTGLVLAVDLLQLLVPGGILAVMFLPGYETLSIAMQIVIVLLFAAVLAVLRVIFVRQIYIAGEKKIRRLRF